MSDPGPEPRRSATWRRGLAAIAGAIDGLPDGVAAVLGVTLGAALVASAIASAGSWAALAGAGLAVVLGRSAGERTPAAGWGRAVVGVAMVGFAGALVTVAVLRAGDRELLTVVVRAEEEVPGFDPGVRGSSGGEEEGSTGGNTGSGDDSTGGVVVEPKGEVEPEPAPERGGGRTVRVSQPAQPEVIPAPSEPVASAGLTGALPRDLGLLRGGGIALDPRRVEPKVAPDLDLRCWSGMAFIAGGSFDGHHIEPFCLDVTEVKVSSYELCMESGKCSEAGTEWGSESSGYSKIERCNRNHKDRGSHPINCVDWNQAKAFCAWAGKRLPTEWEWEWAARGRDEGRTYPWGEEEPTCERAVMDDGSGCGKDRTWHVGSRSKGDSRDGVKDMAGNVWEWTSSRDRVFFVVRGGSRVRDNPRELRASHSSIGHHSSRVFDLGFRCARTAGRPK